MTSQPRAAEVKYYFDADVLGLAKVIVQLRHDVTYPGDPGGTVHRRTRPACPVTTPAVPDVEWLPMVTAQGWLVVTRDANIATRPAELAAVREAGARLVALAGAEAVGTWAQLELLMVRWRDIEALTEQPGPFVMAATRSRLTPVPLV